MAREKSLAGTALAVLTLINLFNYLDRWIVAALAESMKHSELQLSDTELGSLMTGFIVVYMLAAPVFGSLGDTRSRTRLIGLGVALWSVATALAGFARSYASLFAARAAVGIGEAAYGTISPALLADYFPRERRGRVFAIFFAAIPIGSALGYVVGGLVDHYFGWRPAFFVAGVPGIVLAALALRLYEPPRGAHDAVGAPTPSGPAVSLGGAARAAYGALLRNRPYVLTVLGYAAYTFAIGALAFWTPSFPGCCGAHSRRICGSPASRRSPPRRSLSQPSPRPRLRYTGRPSLQPSCCSSRRPGPSTRRSSTSCPRTRGRQPWR